jgi:hypothetical protein
MGRTRATETKVLRRLGNGLVIRRGTSADAEALAAFNCDIHCTPGSDDIPQRIKAWVRDLMSGDHPTFRPQDYAIVEDTKRGEIASSLCLIGQTWSYEGVKFGVGLPELVGTRPQWRRRGLVRVQFNLIHQWSARRGHLVQAIAGIPHFYRQFGYEMGLELGGGREGSVVDAPALKRGERDPFAVRAASEADLPFIARTYAAAMRRYLVTCARDRAAWRYELAGRRRDSEHRRDIGIIESAEGEPVGLVCCPTRLWGNAVGADVYELKPGANWLAVTPSVIRHVIKKGAQYAARQKTDLKRFALWLGSEHPAYRVADWFLPRRRDPYALYVRVPDLPAFVRRIRPVLERRLAESPAPGHTGELRISFYRGGLRMVFRSGRLAQVDHWEPERNESAAFPGHTFLHLLFGHRSLADLQLAYSDCYARDGEAHLLLEALFPKRPSAVWVLG